MSNARFLLRPRWILSHLLIAGMAVGMVFLGFWQLDRLDQRRERNATIRDRQDEPATAVDQLLGADSSDDQVEQARYRSVTATGRYDAEATTAVRNRTQDGVPGAWLLTPLVLDNGERIGVIRGFVPLGDGGDPIPVPVPEGEVTVKGTVASPSGFDGTAPHDIEPVLAEPDTLPALILAKKGSETSQDIAPVPPPDLSEGPHLSYAVQWFIFSTIAAVGYPLALARIVRRRGKEVDDTPDLDRELEDLLHSGS